MSSKSWPFSGGVLFSVAAIEQRSKGMVEFRCAQIGLRELRR
jgi:hypothetical protein